ncbi:MAG: DUF5131 family protein [Candidatus Bathyarchaeia archaeon]
MEKRRWNPVVGCMHECSYCWARRLAEGRLKRTKRYAEGFKPQFIEKELDRNFRKGIVFVSDMGDLFGNFIPTEWIKAVLDRISTMKGADFLLLTKNPSRYLSYPYLIPENCILGATIESDYCYQEISNAPSQFDRLYWMTKLADLMRIRKQSGGFAHRLFISIEPILDFNLESFANMLINWVKPWAVAVGYDNYGNRLPEPTLAKTTHLMGLLEKAGITVYRKTIRKAWFEK